MSVTTAGNIAFLAGRPGLLELECLPLKEGGVGCRSQEVGLGENVIKLRRPKRSKGKSQLCNNTGL